MKGGYVVRPAMAPELLYFYPARNPVWDTYIKLIAIDLLTQQQGEGVWADYSEYQWCFCWS